jgi:hypothetical protein
MANEVFGFFDMQRWKDDPRALGSVPIRAKEPHADDRHPRSRPRARPGGAFRDARRGWLAFPALPALHHRRAFHHRAAGVDRLARARLFRLCPGRRDAKDANRRRDTFVTIGSSNVDDAGKPDISLSLTNNGVGPAILGPIEIRYRGKPVASPAALLEACCTDSAATGLSFATSPSTGVAIRPGESLRFIGLPRTPANEATWQRFQRERWRLSIRSCYCSIFNDCWITEGMQGVPRPVKQCPADWSLYREDASKRLGMTRN